MQDCNIGTMQSYLLRRAEEILARKSVEQISAIMKNGIITIRPPPPLGSVSRMSHNQIIKILRQCPFSPYFAMDNWQFSRDSISKHSARKEVFKMITSTNKLCSMPAIIERSSIEEMSCHSYEHPEQNNGVIVPAEPQIEEIKIVPERISYEVKIEEEERKEAVVETI